MQIGQSESMLRKSLFLWSLIRNRRVLPDGEAERDDTCHDNDGSGGALCNDDDDWTIMVSNYWLPWYFFSIVILMMEEVRVEWKCFDVVLWVWLPLVTCRGYGLVDLVSFEPRHDNYVTQPHLFFSQWQSSHLNDMHNCFPKSDQRKIITTIIIIPLSCFIKTWGRRLYKALQVSLQLWNTAQHGGGWGIN